MLRCLQSAPYGLSHVQPCKEYTVSAWLLGRGASEAYLKVMWTCFLPCGSPAPVWSRNLLPACTCSSSVSSAWSSPPCLNLSTETGDCHMGLMTGAGWVEEHSVIVRGKLLLSYELWKGQVSWGEAEWLAVGLKEKNTNRMEWLQNTSNHTILASINTMETRTKLPILTDCRSFQMTKQQNPNTQSRTQRNKMHMSVHKLYDINAQNLTASVVPLWYD